MARPTVTVSAVPESITDPSALPALDLAQLRAAIDVTLRTIDAREDPEAAYRAATAAGLLGRVLTDEAARRRGAALVRLRAQQKWSIGQLATHIGMSKTRVLQLVDRCGKVP